MDVPFIFSCALRHHYYSSECSGTTLNNLLFEEALMSNDTTADDGPGSGSGLYDELREGMNSIIDKLESEQSKINKAVFEALEKDKRTVYLKKLESQGVKPKRMEKITGRSQSVISRTLNDK